MLTSQQSCSNNCLIGYNNLSEKILEISKQLIETNKANQLTLQSNNNDIQNLMNGLMAINISQQHNAETLYNGFNKLFKNLEKVTNNFTNAICSLNQNILNSMNNNNNNQHPSNNQVEHNNPTIINVNINAHDANNQNIEILNNNQDHQEERNTPENEDRILTIEEKIANLTNKAQLDALIEELKNTSEEELHYTSNYNSILIQMIINKQFPSTGIFGCTHPNCKSLKHAKSRAKHLLDEHNENYLDSEFCT